MKLARAKRVIFWLWMALSGPLILLVVAQISLGKYHDDWAMPLAWLSPLIFPVLGLLIAGTPLRDNPKHEKVQIARSFPIAVIFLSLVYFFALYGVLIGEPFSDLPFITIFEWSGIVLGILQGVVAVMIFRIYVPEE